MKSCIALEQIASTLKQVDVHVWFVSLPDWSWGDDISILSDVELTRSHQLLTQLMRSDYIRSHSALRRVLAAYVGEEPQTLQFGRGIYGRPWLPGDSVEFNLSHSGDWLAIAVARALRVGIDIEAWRDVTERETLLKHHFSSNEVALWRAEATSRREESFARLWTRKEATLKALGSGLINELVSLDAASEPMLQQSLARLYARGAIPEGIAEGVPRMCDLQAPAGYSATLVSLDVQPLVSSYLWYGKEIQRWYGETR